MEIPFYKYQGTGNDFIIVDQWDEQWLSGVDRQLISSMCSRRFGIGADGLMLLDRSARAAFRLQYFNADGLEGSLCGNGSRCAVACMHRLGRFGHSGLFDAYDGLHEAEVTAPGYVRLKMRDVSTIEQGKGFFVLDTGSPHYVTFVEDLRDLDIVQQGRAIRYSNRFRDRGINVNFVQEEDAGLKVYTYERGVENETLSCGTGVTAAALAHAQRIGLPAGPISIETKGGQLMIQFKKVEDRFVDVWLCGPALPVYVGSYLK